MSVCKALENRVHTRYCYDGSMDGFYCCVHESVYQKEMPMEVCVQHSVEPSFFLQKDIVTDAAIAKRVANSLPKHMGAQVYETVQMTFLSCLLEKEKLLLEYILLGYIYGDKLQHMLQHPVVGAIEKATTHMKRETQLLTGVLRFSEANGVLLATISPKNFVLPYLGKHFISRFPMERFLIYDDVHCAAFCYQEQKAIIQPVESWHMPEVCEKEKEWESLWKQFYDSIAIKERENLKRRQSHLPKRYWKNMLEMKELL